MIISLLVDQSLYMLVANGRFQKVAYIQVIWLIWLEHYRDKCFTLNIATMDKVFQHRKINNINPFTVTLTKDYCSDASVENMRFLNVEQALADLAHFIAHIRERHPEYQDSQVIMVGGSYSATMVAFFRQKYPHLAAGAWASSAPMLVKVDFQEYKEVVGASIRSVGGEECYQRLSRAFSQAEQLIFDKKFEEFSKLFRTCDELSDDNPYDTMIIFYSLSELLAGLVQYHRLVHVII